MLGAVMTAGEFEFRDISQPDGHRGETNARAAPCKRVVWWEKAVFGPCSDQRSSMQEVL